MEAATDPVVTAPPPAAPVKPTRPRMMRQYDLVERVRSYNPDTNEDMLNRAYVYAMKAHGEQIRASGDPYFSHPLEVAAILTGLKLDDATIVERFKGKGRDGDQDKGRVQGFRKGGREGRSDTGPSHRPYASSAPREREPSIDPDSPFAKLAALKDQLAGRKD